MASKLGGIKSFVKGNSEYDIIFETGEQGKLYIVNNHVFRYYISPTGEFPEYPEPNNVNDIAKITVKNINDYDKKAFEQSVLEKKYNFFILQTDKIEIHFDKTNGTMIVNDKRSNKEALRELNSLFFEKNEVSQTLYQYKNEHFFGGGMQNGRFSHKGEEIRIVNTNVWTDGGVSSPCPFYWSTYGYGVLRNTWRPGKYNFGSEISNTVTTIHAGTYFDAFYFINETPTEILNDYYDLTGRPTFMPEYAFYESHLNAFNRDYWVEESPETSGAILFEDGKYYKCYQPSQMGDKKGILESLNGEKNNYQFSARAMIDRYKKYDMPLGWFIPNDGYGSGYGQTDSLDGDIENLKEFAEYSRANGVELALWTESNLHPADPLNPKKGERDLGKEVNKAGVVALKCDVAWIGAGYSFGLNAVEDATNIFIKETKNNARPMIIMVDGWAGTQRYAGIWSGDQMGGQWEYIRFHIPTYIGTGLSGMPVIGSDMDGIYAGRDRYVNIRDYQWKAFTPMQLNMDGWGWVQKTPFAFDEEARTINRAYLKIKSTIMPYNYTIGHESVHGLPMIRAMFLEFPKEAVAYTKDVEYQFMWGPSILVAPIYDDQSIDKDSLRNEIYLPDTNQVWIDFFTGEKFQGGKVLNNMRFPLWKIPVYIKDGAIIPFVNPNNNPYEINRKERIFNLYPNGTTTFQLYEDDGLSSDYLSGNFATTDITVASPESNVEGDLYININKTEGSYDKMVKDKSTLLRIMSTRDVKDIKVAINGNAVPIPKVENDEEFESKQNAFYFKKDYTINKYLNELAGKSIEQSFLFIKLEAIDVTKSQIQIKIKNFINEGKVFGSNQAVIDNLKVPTKFMVVEDKTTSNTITLSWEALNADYYEVDRDGVIYTNITNSTISFNNLKYLTKYSFRIRSVNAQGVSKWSDIISGKTMENPQKHVIKEVEVTCNFPCQPDQEISNLTDGNDKTLWHTKWNAPVNRGKGDMIKLNFDLKDTYEIEKIEYMPRDDAGNGTIHQFQYRYSSDGKNWSSLSENIKWDKDSSAKIIEMNGIKMKLFEMHLNETCGCFGSGRKVNFYKKVY